MTTPDLTEARRLLKAGYKLCKLKPLTKEPEGSSWNHSPITKIDDAATGYGLILTPNGLCSIDPDNDEAARKILESFGFDLEEIMSAGVRTVSTRLGSGGRSTFRSTPDLKWVSFRFKGLGNVLELRANSPNLQDAIPGVVYRAKDGTLCAQHYANDRRIEEADNLPPEFLDWWQKMSIDLEFRREQERLAGIALGVLSNQSVSLGRKLAFSSPWRRRFNEDNIVEDILADHGYMDHGDRWSHPAATGAPGIRLIPGKDDLWQSDHAGDPLHGTFDAWTANVVLTHGGDLNAAEAAMQAAQNVEHQRMFDVKGQRDESMRIGEGNFFDPQPEILTVEAMLDRQVFLSDGSRVFDTQHPTHILSFPDFKNSTAASYTETRGDRPKRIPNAVMWLNHPSRKTVVSSTFHAGRGRFVVDPIGRHCINLWHGQLWPRGGNSFGANLFVEHVRWLFKERTDEFLDWLAHIEQKPGELPHTAWLHVASSTGLGRNALAAILARVFPGNTALNFDLMAALNSGFNERLSRKVLVVVDEIREGGSQQWQHSESLKQLITADTRLINPKYGRQSIEFNACRFLLFSNHRSAIPLDDNDRRVEVVINDDQPRSADYYARLYRMIGDPQFIADVAAFLATRDLSAFNPGRHAKKTSDREQVVATSRSAATTALLEFTANYPFELATAARLEIASQMSSYGGGARKFHFAVQGAGWEKLGRRRFKGNKVVFYVRRECFSKWNSPDIDMADQLPNIDGGKNDWQPDDDFS